MPLLNIVGEQPPWTDLVLWAIRGYRNRTDFDDIAQEALLAACISARKQEAGKIGRCSVNRAAVQAAKWAASDYIRFRPGGSRCKELPTLSLDALMNPEGEHEEPWEPTCDDFAPAAIERVWLEEALAKIPGERREILRRQACGYTEVEIAAQLRIKRDRVRGGTYFKSKLRAILCEGEGQ